jgi:hypothetical protein
MKKNLLALAALGASVALLAGCGTATPEVTEETGAVVVETPVVETPVVDASGTAVDTTTATTDDTTTPTTAE